MKIYKLVLCTLLAQPYFSCNSRPDSEKEAKNENEARIDSQKQAIDSTGVTNGASNVSTSDADFMAGVSQGGKLEMELGKSAMHRAGNEEVRNFGKLMMSDHEMLGKKLETIAHRKNISLPVGFSDKSQKAIQSLNDASNKDFDKKYVDMMISGHKDVADAFQKEIKNGTDTTVVAFAKENLPVILEHYSKAKALKQTTKGL